MQDIASPDEQFAVEVAYCEEKPLHQVEGMHDVKCENIFIALAHHEAGISELVLNDDVVG